MKTKVLFSALCLLVSISVCAGSKNTAKNGSTTKQTKVVQVEDGNVVVVNTTDLVSGIYTISVKTSQGVMTKRFTVIH